jgi:antitoxin MazE
MTITLSKWGNSLAVRIPKDALEDFDLHEGDLLDVVTEDGRLVLLPIADSPTLDELIAQITPDNIHGEIFRTPVGAEIW